MKKQLTKEEKQKRKDQLNKWLRRLLYMSLAFNVLFIICIAVSCSQQKPSNTNEPQVEKVERNRRVDNFDTFSNDSVKVYDLNNFHYTEGVTRYSGGVVVLQTNENLMLFGSDPNEDYSGVTHVHCWANIHYPNQQNDIVGIYAYHYEDLMFGVEWEYLPYEQHTRDGWSYRYNGSANLGCYLGFNESYIATNSNVNFNVFVEDLFAPIDYYDFYNTSWNVFNAAPLTRQSDTQFVYYVQDIMFSVQGVLYDSIRFDYDTVNPSIYYPVGNSWSSTPKNDGTDYLFTVQFYNHASGVAKVVYMAQGMVNNDGVGGYKYGVYDLQDYNLLKIRLYGINLVQGNTDIVGKFSYQSDYAFNYESSVGSSSGVFGDVFALVGIAFAGCVSLLSINVLPNISLGVFLMLPLVALIVFAIIRVVKK